MTETTHQEKRHFQTEVKQLLDIVVHSLYSNKEIFLRELISNASDALDKLRFAVLSDSSLYESDPNLSIWIRFDEKAKTLTISDNGIGMSRVEVIDNLGTIAKSGTREFLSQLSGDQKKDANLIGQFGVGFYSAFIVANKVTVLTHRAGLASSESVCWESTGDGEYLISDIEKTTRGTDIILHIKEGQEEFLSEWRLRNIITKYSDHLNVPILMPKMENDEDAPAESTTPEWETVNRATALWALPKNAVKEEAYQEFYKHISHDDENPLAFTHHKIEGGNIDYLALLYLPLRAPADIWNQDKQHGLKLYVQRVLIMDQVEQFMPHYLRFVRGVIDTNALPLNISREILQDHPVIGKLRSALVKHILDLLDRLVKDEPAKYATFWKEFGNVLKEGPAEDFTNRLRIAKLLRFSSTHTDSAAQTVSLDDYVQRMKSNQKHIYYVTADSFNAAKSSPHLEVFRQNNIEVLLLTDRIDEWLVSHLHEYEGKKLQSVAKGDIHLDELASKPEENKASQSEFDGLLSKMKTILADVIKDVKLSHRLTTSPACLVREENALGPQMERLLKAAGQEVAEVKPMLEINAGHKLVKKIQSQGEEEDFADWVHLLYEQALLAEGGTLPDPATFVQRMNKLWC